MASRKGHHPGMWNTRSCLHSSSTTTTKKKSRFKAEIVEMGGFFLPSPWGGVPCALGCRHLVGANPNQTPGGQFWVPPLTQEISLETGTFFGPKVQGGGCFHTHPNSRPPGGGSKVPCPCLSIALTPPKKQPGYDTMENRRSMCLKCNI